MPSCGQPLKWKPARFFLLTISISAIMLTVYLNNRDSTILIADNNGSLQNVPNGDTLEPTIISTTIKPPLRKIYIVTPTYTRATQMADMTRLAQTLRLVPSIHWIVVEDAIRLSKQVTKLLNQSRINHTHILGPTPGNKKLKIYGKGVASRRKALEWVRENAEDSGVLYFADDDNAYDVRIFEEMRSTVKVSVWPVGLIFGYGMSTPILVNGKVIGFHDSYIKNRVFAMDMAGFAVSIQLLNQYPNATMEHKLGYLEDSFLRALNITLADLEPKANNCTEVLVWHTKTLAVPKAKVQNLKKVKSYNKTNLISLYRNVLTRW